MNSLGLNFRSADLNRRSAIQATAALGLGACWSKTNAQASSLDEPKGLGEVPTEITSRLPEVPLQQVTERIICFGRRVYLAEDIVHPSLLETVSILQQPTKQQALSLCSHILAITESRFGHKLFTTQVYRKRTIPRTQKQVLHWLSTDKDFLQPSTTRRRFG